MLVGLLTVVLACSTVAASASNAGLDGRLWVDQNRLNQRAEQLLQAVQDGAIHGLDAAWYGLDAVRRSIRQGDWAEVERGLTRVFLLQAEHRAQGIVQPGMNGVLWNIPRAELNAQALLGAVVNGADVRAELDALWPRSGTYRALLDAKRKLLEHAADRPPPSVPPGKLIRPDMQDVRVPLLRKRLLGSRSTQQMYTVDLVTAVVAFQRSRGLQADGVVGPKTIAALNRPDAELLAQLDVNLERWRWLPRQFPERYLWVNIAAFKLIAVRDDEAVLDMAVIVGRGDRQTAVFTADLQYVVFNPYWDVPHRIAVIDKLPDLKTGAADMAARGYEVAIEEGAGYVPVDQVDWQPVTAESFAYRLRQRPGPYNALGRLKFILPNDYAIYLHDTPDKALFARDERSFSSGCVRVADATRLAHWVLHGGADPEPCPEIEAIVSSGLTRTVHLAEPLLVYIVYFTADTDASGTMTLHPDLYQLDDYISTALKPGAQRGEIQ